jgi:hypothetical protein
MRVIQGTAALRRQSAIEAAYDHFRLDRQGNLVSANTLQHYRYLVGPFFDSLREAHPDVEGFEDLDVSIVRHYRAELATQGFLCGGPLPLSLRVGWQLQV